MAQIYTRAGGEALLNTTAARIQMDSVLGALSTGGFVAAWTVFGFGEPLRGQRFDSTGAKLGGEFSIAILAGAIIDSASIVGLANGGFMVAWGVYGDSTDPSQYNVKAQLFDSAGAKTGGELVLSQSSADGQMLPDLSPVPGGGFLATWMDYVGDNDRSCIKGQLFDAQGAKTGAEFVVNTTTAGQQLSPSAALLTDGFVVTWQDSVPDGDHNGVAIRAQRFSADGTKAGAELLVSIPGGAQIEPEVAGLSGGGFVVVWEHRGTGNVHGQVYDSAGAPVGGQFTVNTSTFSEQSQPAVAALPWGGFVVSWTDFSGQPADSSGAVRAQIFDSAGAKTGSEFVVNLVTAQDQQEPDLTVLTSGAFVASWTSKAAPGGDGAGDGIKAQIFAPGGPGLGTIDYSGDSGPVAVNLTASFFLFPAGHPHASRSLGPGEALDGSGNYEIVAGIENFILTGGNDRLVGSELANRVAAGGGNDRIDGAGGNDVILGEAGDDRIGGDAGNDEIDGGDNEDILAGGAGQDVLTGGNGSDQLFSHGVDPAFTGVHTSPGISYDVFAEVDTLTGGAGTDFLFAGTGDHVHGGTDDGLGDRLYISFRGAASGVTADFRLLSTAQPITIAGGTISGVEIVDFIEGSEFDDMLASYGHHYMFATRVYGRGGNDELIAHFGAGVGGGGFWGGDGNDRIDASATPYAPALYGEAGNDVLIGGEGHDKMDGGSGIDTAIVGADAVFASNGSNWTVTSPYTRIDTLTGIEIVKSSGQNTLLVGSGGFATIQEAVDAAQAGDTIRIAAGTYVENVNVNKDVTILGPNQGVAGTATRAAEAVVDGMVTISTDGVTIDGLKFVGRGVSPLGGHDAVVVLADDFTLTNSVFDAAVAANAAVDTGQFLTGLEISNNLVQGYPNGIAIGVDVAGSVHDNRFQGGTGMFGVGNGLVSLSSNLTIVDNIFDGIYSHSLALAPWGPDSVDLGSFVTGNNFTNSGSAQPVLILPTRDSPNIVGTDHDELFDAPGSGYADSGNVFSLDGAGGDDHIIGEEQGDRLSGGSGDDALFGNGGNDLLDGGTGADSMTGGVGNDVYIVDSAGDSVTELPGEGTDEVQTALAAYALEPEVENLKGLSASGQALTGNGLGNFIVGGAGGDTLVGGGGNDRLNAGAGADIMRGGLDDDVYAVDNAGDVVEENAGEGTDMIVTTLAAYSLLGTQVENLFAVSAVAHDLRGNALDNTITAGSGNDFFRLQDGGDDIANGGGGNDVFLFGGAMTAADQVDGGSGTDQIVLQGDYAGGLTFGLNVIGVENIAILHGSDTRFGDPGTSSYDYDITTRDINVAAGVEMVVDANRLRLGEDFTFNGASETDGSFFIYGGSGVDLLTGGAKNDVFLFGAGGQWGASDIIVGGAGLDQLALRGNYTLTFGAGQLVGIENIGLLSAHDTRFGTLGSSYSYNLNMVDENVASGVQMTVDGARLRIAENFTFNGSAETDGSFRVFGGLVDDVITGSRNADLIQGNGGADSLTGGAGADIFRYLEASDSTAAAADHILDFTPGSDKIDLSRIDASTTTAGDQAFSWIGSNAFSGSAGQLRAFQQGGDWILEGDTDGNGSADFVVLLSLDGPTPLSVGDFFL